MVNLPHLESPELIFGIAGPIGVDVDGITEALKTALHAVEYKSLEIKLTKEMKIFAEQRSLKIETKTPDSSNFESYINHRIEYANKLCSIFRDSSTLARVAMWSISRLRKQINSGSDQPLASSAYILRQLKRPEEVSLLRKVYGRQFVLVSAYSPTDIRLKFIEEKLRRTSSALSDGTDISSTARKLIDIDYHEDRHFFGQKLRETFHLADVFVDASSYLEMKRTTSRFVDAFFGKTDIAPSKIEHGMYTAKSASLRSSDLSRQVGAALFTDDGDLITIGCNEVPKAFGGAYWDLEAPDWRDVRLGYDPNDDLKRELLRDLIERLQAADLLTSKLAAFENSAEIVNHLTKKIKTEEDRVKSKETGSGALTDAMVMDLTEYGRVVHAEMCAICDAARLGRSIKGSTLFCTTFPCHNCTKHIISSGIKKVIYIEPYPKSKAKDLHHNEIELEKESIDHVSFMPFLGISPFRYRDIFQKGRRKNSDGRARTWVNETDKPRPLPDLTYPSYMDVELHEQTLLFEVIKEKT